MTAANLSRLHFALDSLPLRDPRRQLLEEVESCLLAAPDALGMLDDNRIGRLPLGAVVAINEMQADLARLFIKLGDLADMFVPPDELDVETERADHEAGEYAPEAA